MNPRVAWLMGSFVAALVIQFLFMMMASVPVTDKTIFVAVAIAVGVAFPASMIPMIGKSPK